MKVCGKNKRQNQPFGRSNIHKTFSELFMRNLFSIPVIALVEARITERARRKKISLLIGDF